MKSKRGRFNIRFLVLGILLPVALSAWLPATEVQPGPSPGALEPQAQSADARAWNPQEIDSLVAPIALYPDPLLAQVLAASTYPLELVEAQQWLKQHTDLQGQALIEAAAKEDWDPSVQALVVFPSVLDRLTEDIRWTTDLGNVFLAQQQDVMDAVQRLRLEAKNAGRLNSSREQEVTTKVVQEKTIVEIVPASPDVIYVPVYSPEVIWGPPAYYAYPALWYPPWPSAAGFWIGFGAGISLGWYYPGWDNWYYYGWRGCADWTWGWGWGWHGWGWGCGWGPYSTVYYNNYFCNHYGYHHHDHGYGHGYDHGHGHGNDHGHSNYGSWQHDSYHRSGVAYGSQNAARRYGANNGRTVNTRTSTTSRNYALGGRSSQNHQSQGRTANRTGTVSRSSGTTRNTGTVARGSRGETVYTNRSSNRASSANPSFRRDTATSTYRSQASGQNRTYSRSTYSRSNSTASGRTGGTVTIGGSSPNGRNASSGETITIGRSYNRSPSTSGSNRSAYGSSPSSGSRSIYSGRTSSSGYSSGSRTYSNGGSYSNRPSSSGYSSGSRAYSSSRSSSGRSYSGGSSSSGRSYSSGSSYRGGSSSGHSSGGRSSGGGGGSRGGSSGGGHRR
jgi:hypothetical protein